MPAFDCDDPLPSTCSAPHTAEFTPPPFCAAKLIGGRRFLTRLKLMEPSPTGS